MLWLLSTAIGKWGSPGRGIAVLCVGGALIFPVTQLVLRAMGRPAREPPGPPPAFTDTSSSALPTSGGARVSPAGRS